MDKQTAPSGAQAVLRALALLKSFSAGKPEQSLGQLCRSLGLTKTTTHRLLAALQSEGFITRNGVTGAYRLGPMVITLGSLALVSSDLRQVVRPALESLALETGETVTLEVLSGDQMLVLDGLAGVHRVSARLDIGTRWPLHACSTGKAYLAALDNTQVMNMVPGKLKALTEETITDRAALLGELERIRERGYATNFEELEADYVAVSAVFHTALGSPEGAIAIGGPASRLSEKKLRQLGPLVYRAASALSSRHDHQGEEVSLQAHFQTVP